MSKQAFRVSARDEEKSKLAKKPVLGRNLGALLGDISKTNVTTSASDTSKSVSSSTQAESSKHLEDNALLQISVQKIVPSPYQPRRDIDEEALKDLADSIAAQGIIQPIVVRQVKANQYELIAGERRWRAAQLVGLDTIPAMLKDIDDATAMALALIENIQREQLNPIEEAYALKRLTEEFAMTHQAVAKAVGRSRTSVTNLMRLLTLQAPVIDFLENGKLEMGHARALLTLEAKDQIQLAQQVVNLGLSVRQTERLARTRGEAQGVASKAAPDPDVLKLQKSLTDLLGLSVHIKHAASGKGKVQIAYRSLKELETLIEKLDNL